MNRSEDAEELTMELHPYTRQKLRELAIVYRLTEEEMAEVFITQQMKADPYGLIEQTGLEVDWERLDESVHDLLDRHQQRLDRLEPTGEK